jgi:DNA polymerase I
MVARILLVDGNSLTYRAFFALPTDLATASGQVTNAVYGFTSMLINVIRDHQPDGIVVAFDRPEPTFRHDRAVGYKAQREQAPDILRQQMGLVREVLEALAIPMVETAGFEADDLIATMATVVRDAGNEAIIVTGDRDVYQLVEDPAVKVLYNRRGVSDYTLYDEAGIEERTGVPPRLYPQYAALRGDPSDNLPGVPKVGEKTAAKLINAYGSLDGVFAHVDEQSPALRKNLAEHEAQARLNHEVMLLVRDAPLDLDVNAVRWGDVDPEEVSRVFTFLEFSSLYERLNEVLEGRLPEVEGAGPIEAEISRPATAAEAALVLRTLAAGDRQVAVSAAYGAGTAGTAVVTDASVGDVAWIDAALFDDDAVREAARAVLGGDGPGVNAHDAKRVMKALWRVDVDLAGLDIDCAIAGYLIDADSRYDLADLVARYLRRELPGDDSVPDGQLDLAEAGTDPALRAAREALAVALLAPVLAEQLDRRDLRRLYDDIERPLVRVLAKMEEAGVCVDVAELTRLRDFLVAECRRHEQAVWDAAGHQFNVNSTKQLRDVLFDELGLIPQKRTKTGFSTDAQTLERMRGTHPVVDHLLEFREVEKLRSTYGQGLLDTVGPDGRIHATFNQTVARTGRLSSEDPNLHNIPVRSEQGRVFRRAFIPAEGCEFLVADYNQIELRVIAHLARDPGLIEAFESGQDIHNATASRVFSVDPDRVTIDQRSKAKMVSYGLAYGMEAYGLGQRLNIPTEEAAVILEAYFEAFPRVKQYMADVVAETRRKGYTETMFGRRRPIPELSSSNYRVRQAAERQAMNAPIQGLAADIFKVALVRLDAALEGAGAESRLVLQVHDEVILEVPPAERDQVTDLTVSTMKEAADLLVPLEVNVAYGDSWASAKS